MASKKRFAAQRRKDWQPRPSLYRSLTSLIISSQLRKTVLASSKYDQSAELLGMVGSAYINYTCTLDAGVAFGHHGEIEFLHLRTPVAKHALLHMLPLKQ
jgi:hypothetical protein